MICFIRLCGYVFKRAPFQSAANNEEKPLQTGIWCKKHGIMERIFIVYNSKKGSIRYRHHSFFYLRHVIRALPYLKCVKFSGTFV